MFLNCIHCQRQRLRWLRVLCWNNFSFAISRLNKSKICGQLIIYRICWCCGIGDNHDGIARDAPHLYTFYTRVYVSTQQYTTQGSLKTCYASESPHRCPCGACIETSQNARPVYVRSFDKRAHCSRMIVTMRSGRGEPVAPLQVPLLYIPTTVLRYQFFAIFEFYVWEIHSFVH